MATQYSARIAGQSVHFRGTSTVSMLPAFAIPNARAIADAVYTLRVTGGVSGSFGVTVLGVVGMHGTAGALANSIVAGTTVALAGVTAIGAAGTFVLFPYNYGIDGLGVIGFTAGGGILNRIDQLVPPSTVAFQSGVATVGISAHCVVNACLRLV